MLTTYPHAPRPHRVRTISVTPHKHSCPQAHNRSPYASTTPGANNNGHTPSTQPTPNALPSIHASLDNGFIQSLSRTGNCVDNGATEQLFGHLKAKVFRSQDWQTFESLKADLDASITHWDTVRRQVTLKGLTPAEYRDQALQEAA